MSSLEMWLLALSAQVEEPLLGDWEEPLKFEMVSVSIYTINKELKMGSHWDLSIDIDFCNVQQCIVHCTALVSFNKTNLPLVSSDPGVRFSNVRILFRVRKLF